ncbi:MAG: RNA polymerase sigma factor [Kiloniellaceae bacterium]
MSRHSGTIRRRGGARHRASAPFEDLHRLVKGEKAAWDRFVAGFAPVIYAAVQRRLVPAGRGDDAEDVAQDVFLRLCANDFRLLKSYDAKRARLTTWLTVIATSAAIDHLRRLRRPTQPLEAVPESRLAVEPRNPERVKIPPDLLSPRQALVLELLHRREMDVAEAAAFLGVAPQTVRSTHHKALVKLRAHFREPEP